MVRSHKADVGPTPIPSLLVLTVGPDQRSIWFALFHQGRIGRLDLTTNQITEYDCRIRPDSNPLYIAVGPDKNIWFSEEASTPDPTLPGGIARFVPPTGLGAAGQ